MDARDNELIIEELQKVLHYAKISNHAVLLNGKSF